MPPLPLACVRPIRMRPQETLQILQIKVIHSPHNVPDHAMLLHAPVNIDEDIEFDSKQICAVVLMYDYGTNYNDPQHNFSTSLINVHAILNIFCSLCCC